MKVKFFTIRLDSNFLEIDQNSLNDFLETVAFVKSDTHFVDSEPSHWSVVVHYEEIGFETVNHVVPEKQLSESEQELFQNLKNWRSLKAEQLGLKHFMICHNSELMNIAVNRPSSLSELKKIKGFGNLKSEKFGEDIISLLKAV